MPRFYDELADWWPLFSHPSDYAEEAATYAGALLAAGTQPTTTLLELGSGGGNNASYLKAHFEMTLSDLSAGMLAVSERLNPKCEHVEGDLRTLRLGRTFDRVFVHDAICYMTTLADLGSAMETAYVHCREGGAAVFAPDLLLETFRPGVEDGGHDGEDRALRYLAWTWDPDPTDHAYTVDYAFMLRDRDGSMRVEHDRHIEGLFARSEWLRLLSETGFTPKAVPFEHSEVESGTLELFVGVRE